MTVIQKLAANGMQFDTVQLGQSDMTFGLSESAPMLEVHPGEKIVISMNWSLEIPGNNVHGLQVVESGWSSRFPEVKPRSFGSNLKYTRAEVMHPMRPWLNSICDFAPLVESTLRGT